MVTQVTQKMYCLNTSLEKLQKRTVTVVFYISLGKSNPERFETFTEFNEMNLSELQNAQHVEILDLVHIHCKR